MPGEEAQEAPKLLFINAGERGESRQREWRTIRCGHCADCQYSQSPNFNRSQITPALEEMNYTGPSRVRN